MRRTKSFNKQKNGDGHKLDPIHQHLTRLGYKVFREPVIENHRFSTRNKIRNPDLKIVYGKFEVYLEVDGKVHGILEAPTENTLKRNADFERTNMNYIVLSEEDCKFHGIDIEKLAAYRVGEEYTKFLAKVENGSLFI